MDDWIWLKLEQVNYNISFSSAMKSILILPNPLTLEAAKTGLMIWEISYLQNHFMGNIWRRNDDQKLNSNSASNILWAFAHSQVMFESMKVADDTFQSNSEWEWVKLFWKNIGKRGGLQFFWVTLYNSLTCLMDLMQGRI